MKRSLKINEGSVMFQGCLLHKRLYLFIFGLSVMHGLLYTDSFVASKLKDLFLYCCIKNVLFVWLFLLVSDEWRMVCFGNISSSRTWCGSLDLSNFNSTNNRNWKKQNFKAEKEVFLCLGYDIYVIQYGSNWAIECG